MDLLLSFLGGCIGVRYFHCWYKDNRATGTLPDVWGVVWLPCADLYASACLMMSFNEVNWIAAGRMSVWSCSSSKTWISWSLMWKDWRSLRPVQLNS